MIENCILKFKNYKCFQNESTLLITKPINVIIGKNNSGKSTVLEIIEYASNPVKNYEISEIDLIYGIEINEDLIKSIPTKISIDPSNIGKHLYFNLYNDKKTKFIGSDILLTKEQNDFFSFYKPVFSNPLYNKIFTKIAAERDIIPGKENNLPSEKKINPKGDGFVNLLQNLVNSNYQYKELIEDDFREAINKITEPEIKIDKLHISKLNMSYWEIFLKTNNKTISISNMGSGIKTILLILAHFVVLPKYNAHSLAQFIFAIEEPENNLHPAILRRLLMFIKEKVLQNNTSVFLTSHSNIVIDFFNNVAESDIIHLTHKKGNVEIKYVKEFTDKLAILEDLQFKASDLFQSNCIIWVEGPSDRTYINKWISLVDPSLKEGFHYSIMFYGGRLLKNLSCDKKECNENEINDFISLVKINPNIILVMDSDKESEEDVINDTKLRIHKELGKENSWITDGREIENYLSKRTINMWLNNDENTALRLEKYNKVLDELKNYSKDKHESSREIVKFIDENDLDIYDLKEKISSICQKIRKWNFIDTPIN